LTLTANERSALSAFAILELLAVLVVSPSLSLFGAALGSGSVDAFHADLLEGAAQLSFWICPISIPASLAWMRIAALHSGRPSPAASEYQRVGVIILVLTLCFRYFSTAFGPPPLPPEMTFSDTSIFIFLLILSSGASAVVEAFARWIIKRRRS
jgi:hypothetical protein